MNVKLGLAVLMTVLTVSSTSFASDAFPESGGGPLLDTLSCMGNVAVDAAEDSMEKSRMDKQIDERINHSKEVERKAALKKEADQRKSAQKKEAMKFFSEAKAIQSKKDRATMLAHELGLSITFSSSDLALGLRTQFGLEADVAKDMAEALVK